MQVEIINPQGNVAYRRPHDHPDVMEALKTPGYSVRGESEGVASDSRPAPCCAALIEWLKAEILEDEGAMINARDHGEWDRYHRLDGHRGGFVHVIHHIRAAQHNR